MVKFIKFKYQLLQRVRTNKDALEGLLKDMRERNVPPLLRDHIKRAIKNLKKVEESL